MLFGLGRSEGGRRLRSLLPANEEMHGIYYTFATQLGLLKSQSKNKLALFDARNARGSMNGALFSSLSSWREKNWTVHGFINTQSYCHGFFLVFPPAKCAFTFGIGAGKDIFIFLGKSTCFFCFETF